MVSVARAAPQEWTGDPARGAAELEQQWAEIEHPTPETGIRGIFRFALEGSATQWHPERVTAALELARSMQDVTAGSPTYGNFHWRYGDTQVTDPNAAEYAMQLAGLLRVKYTPSLSPEGLQQIDQIMDAAIEGLTHHQVPLADSSVYLTQAWDLIALGEMTKNAAVAETGYQNFKAWVRFTVGNGISEYGAVTQYGVGLDSLGLIHRYVGRPEVRVIAEKALDYFWTDIAANWWAAGDRLACANSRCSDTLYGRGYLEAHTWEAGWLRTKPQLENAEWLAGPHDNLVAFRRDVTWVPPAEVTEKIRGHLPRTVVQRWSGAPLELRVTAFVSDHVSLASAGNTHSADERTLVANLGSSPAIAQVTMFMAGRGDPYGADKTRTALGETPARHLTPFLCAVQRGPEVLQLLSDEPSGAAAASGLYTQLIVPAEAAVFAGNQAVKAGTPDRPTLLPPGQPIFMVKDDAVVAVRLLYAAGTDGKPAPVEFISDGSDRPARRITIVHSAAAPHGRGTTVAWFRVADGLDAAKLARFRRDFASAKAKVELSGDELRVDAAGAENRLRIIARLEDEDRRQLAGQEPDGLLAVNGYDLGLEMLEEFGAH